VSDAFTLETAPPGARLELQGPLAQDVGPYEDSSYGATLDVGKLSATIRVDDANVWEWSRYFADLAAHWRGWAGEKAHESLHHHLRISCTNSVGHIEFLVRLRGDPQSGSGWAAEASIAVENGQLDAIARAAKAFFGEPPAPVR